MVRGNGVRPENKIECFCLNLDQRIAYAGTVGGALIGYSIDDLSPKFEIDAHAGLIAAAAHHPSRNLVACMSADNTVSVWRTPADRPPVFLCRIPLWNLQPSNDKRFIPDFQSESQALAFHDDLPRLATRSANGALLEIDIDDFGHYKYRHCTRIFESADLTCVRYVPGNSLLLAGSIGGQLGLVFDGEVVGNVVTGGSNIHWIEPVGRSEFLLASDSRQVLRVDLYDFENTVIGPKFCRDDLEHVALSNDGLSAYAGSFDRNIYRVDPRTCEAQEIVFKAPFKCRWVRPLPGEGERIMVQTRDGGLHLVDAKSKRALKSVRLTPPAFWTSDQRDHDRIYLAGELDAVLTVDFRDNSLTAAPFGHLSTGNQTYTKRLISLAGDNGCLLGRTDGTLIHVRDDQVVGSARLGAAVRDLCEGPDQTAFAALEDGRVLGINLDDLAIFTEFVSPVGEPIWSLAYNGQKTLAIAERGGRLRMLSARSLEQISEHTQLVRPKRMKWRDPAHLLFVWSDQLRALNVDDGTERLLVDSIGNTIEDFIVCLEYDYLVFISYMRNIYLARLRSGEILCSIPDGVDYSKGLAWERPSLTVDHGGAPQFVTYGRHGRLDRYRILNQKILPCGQIALPEQLEALQARTRGQLSRSAG